MLIRTHSITFYMNYIIITLNCQTMDMYFHLDSSFRWNGPGLGSLPTLRLPRPSLKGLAMGRDACSTNVLVLGISYFEFI
jgi:hypothetical protein